MLTALAFTVALQYPSCCGFGMSQFAQDPAFIASHVAPLPFQFQPKSGKMIEFTAADGKKAKGFFVPAKAGNTTALVVVHEWWGLNDYIKQEAEKLHDELGSAVLAVDMYEGQVATDQKTAASLMGKVDSDRSRATAISKGAVTALKGGELFKARKIGTVGWCFGGGWSFWTTVNGGSDVQACVIYYGMPSTDPAVLAQLRAPVLMIWGKQDNFINAKVVDDFKTAMHNAKKSLQTVSYDAVHGFANPSNPKFDAAATADAHKRTIDFLRRNLR